MNDLGSMRFDLGEQHLDRRLDQVLVELLGDRSRTSVQALIKAGGVLLAGQPILKPGHLVLERAVLEIIPLASETPVATPLSTNELIVLHADEHLLVLVKPAGVLTHSNVENGEAGIAEIAAERFGALPEADDDRRPGVVHRLDRDTSGVILLARTPLSLGALQSQFRDREVAKTYLALVHGVPRFDTEWIDQPLGRHERARDRISVMPAGQGREATTYYEVKERFQDFALLEVHPKTGRTHQVRVHLAHAHMPIVGDAVYHPRGKVLPKLPPECPPMQRQALHAAVLEFTHPVSAEPMRFEAPLPADMSATIDWLRAHRPLSGH